MATYTVNLTVTGTITDDGTTPPPGGTTPPPGAGLPPDLPVAPDAVPPPAIAAIPADAVWCGPSKPIKEPADAVASVPAGGTLVLEDGRYLKAFHVETEGITIRSASGNPYKCYLDGQGGYGGGHRLAWGKGMLHTNKSATVIGIGFRACGSVKSGTTYSNEAGVWAGDTAAGSPVNVLVQRCAFDNNANGCFCAGEANIKFVVAECIYGHIAPNGMNAAAGGASVGPAHDNYLAAGTVEVSHSYFYGCCNGHNVKSRAGATYVHDNPCLTQDGGRALDACDGGDVRLTNNTIHTRTDRAAGMYSNSNCIAYCNEGVGQGARTFSMAGNTLHLSRLNSTIWAAHGTIESANDTVQYYGNGSLQLQGNVIGLSQGSAPPGSPAAPALPAPPAWAAV